MILLSPLLPALVLAFLFLRSWDDARCDGNSVRECDRIAREARELF